MIETALFLAVAILAAYKIHADVFELYPAWAPYEWALELITAAISFIVASVALLPLWTGVI